MHPPTVAFHVADMHMVCGATGRTHWFMFTPVSMTRSVQKLDPDLMFTQYKFDICSVEGKAVKLKSGQIGNLIFYHRLDGLEKAPF